MPPGSLSSNKTGFRFTKAGFEHQKKKDIRLDDRIVTEAVCEKLGIAVLIHNVYIKNALQRELIMESSYPNATVCSVRDVSFIEANEIVPLHPDFDTGTQLE